MHTGSDAKPTVFVAIDIAKAANDVVVEFPNGKRKRFRVANCLDDFQKFRYYLSRLSERVVIGFEATGNYHRPLAFFLSQQGFELFFISSIAAARTREALYNSWDKNDPKDAQVILHLLRTGVTQHYHDPVVNDFNDLQELSKTHFQISLRKVRVQHSILTHYLPLYFPEMDKYFHTSRALWFSRLLQRFPCPSSITRLSLEEFHEQAWDIIGRKVNKAGFLNDLYATAQTSIGVPVAEDSDSMRMFRIVLSEHQHLCEARAAIELEADKSLSGNPDYQRLRTIPGIGPILALTILAEAGNLRRFAHYRQFLKFCGLDLSTQQSGQSRGQSKLSKRGNGRLRYAFWMAANIAIRMGENSFCYKYQRYIKTDPKNPDRKRKAYTAVAAKMARVAHGLIKNESDYRPYFEEAIPSGKIPSLGP